MRRVELNVCRWSPFRPQSHQIMKPGEIKSRNSPPPHVLSPLTSATTWQLMKLFVSQWSHSDPLSIGSNTNTTTSKSLFIFFFAISTKSWKTVETKGSFKHKDVLSSTAPPVGISSSIRKGRVYINGCKCCQPLEILRYCTQHLLKWFVRATLLDTLSPACTSLQLSPHAPKRRS